MHTHVIIVNQPFENINISYFLKKKYMFKEMKLFFQTNRNIPGLSIQLKIKSNDFPKHDLFPINLGYM